MKFIIAGGRDYKFTVKDCVRLRPFVDSGIVTEVVCGGATGADDEGRLWAEAHGIPVKPFLPDWKANGDAAGPIRNREMAAYADAVILFPGGKGTESMYREAKRAGIKIYDFRKLEQLSGIQQRMRFGANDAR